MRTLVTLLTIILFVGCSKNNPADEASLKESSGNAILVKFDFHLIQGKNGTILLNYIDSTATIKYTNKITARIIQTKDEFVRIESFISKKNRTKSSIARFSEDYDFALFDDNVCYHVDTETILTEFPQCHTGGCVKIVKVGNFFFVECNNAQASGDVKLSVSQLDDISYMDCAMSDDPTNSISRIDCEGIE